MGLVELSNSGAHHIGCFFEMVKLYNVLDSVADKMNDIWEIKHSWNFLDEKFTMEPSIACTVAHNSAYSRPADQVDNL